MDNLKINDNNDKILDQIAHEVVMKTQLNEQFKNAETHIKYNLDNDEKLQQELKRIQQYYSKWITTDNRG